MEFDDAAWMAALDRVLECYFLRTGCHGLEDEFARNACWIGPGAQELCTGLDEIIALFLREADHGRRTAGVTLKWSRPVQIAPELGGVLADVELTQPNQPPERFQVSLILHREDKWRICQLHLSRPCGTVACGLADEVSTRPDLLHLAYTDALTELSNENALMEMMEQILRGQETWAIGLVDVDRFKYINDACGRETGDTLLRELGQGLRKQIHLGEFCARLVSDQFVVLLRCGSTQQALGRMEKLVRNLTTHQLENGISVNLSAGVAMYRPGAQGCQDANGLINQALLAAKAVKKIYASEKIGIYDSEFVKQHKRRQVLELQLERALQNREFKLYLQPQVHLETGEIIGAECLSRWHSPTLGLIMPEEFITLMENNGVAIELDFFMLESACQQMRVWRDMGLRVPLSVNQSRIHFFHPEYLNRVKALLERYEVGPGELTLELTETTFYQNEQKIQEASRALRAMGVQLAIDDFGTGYSSLSLLNNTDVDIVKLDKNFLDYFYHGTKRNQTIFRKTVELVRELGLSIVFEGVETENQRQRLRELGCRYAQGFLFAEPMPVEEFEARYLSVPAKEIGAADSRIESDEAV